MKNRKGVVCDGTFKIYQGTKDYLADEYTKGAVTSKVYREIQEEFIRTAERFGFKEIIVPTIEVSDLYNRGVGETTDIVEKEMYTIQTGKESITLRPEGTAGVIRAYIQNKIYVSPNETVKLSYQGSMFRKERPQAGRQREFTQLGLEAIGAENPYADAEIISAANSFLEGMGVKTFTLQLNSIGCSDCRGEYKKVLTSFLDTKELCEDCRERKKKNPLRALDCKNENCQKEYVTAPLLKSCRCETCESYYSEVKRLLTMLDVPFEENEKLVRGLDYYSGIAFEFVEESIGSQSTICGGGRYSDLVKELGGPEVSGAGFAIGLERLLIVLEKNGLINKKQEELDYYLIWTNEETRDVQMKIANSLRKKGYKAEMEYAPKKMKSQFKTADRKSAKYCLILGEDELKNGVISLKDMASGEQVTQGLDFYI